MRRGLAWLVLALGCAPTESAPTPEPRWRVPDGECGDVHEPTSLLDLPERATPENELAAIESIGSSPTPDHLAELLAIDAHERERVYYEALHGDAAQTYARAHERRAAIDRIVAENSEAVLELALARDRTEHVAALVASAKHPDRVAALLEHGIACRPERLDAGLVYALSQVPDGAGLSALRRMVQWPAWPVQVMAFELLERANDAELPRLREQIATRHWSRAVREKPAVIFGRIDHGANGCEQGLPDPIAVTRGEETLEIAAFEWPRKDVPRHQLPPAYVNISGRRVDLRDDADMMLAIDDGWLVGVNQGEFGGGLHVVRSDGNVRTLDSAPVLEIQRTDLGIVVLTGLSHLGTSEGRILGITRDASGRLVRRHRLELPARPEGMRALPGGTLLVATAAGIVELAPDDTVSLLPCTNADE